MKKYFKKYPPRRLRGQKGKTMYELVVVWANGETQIFEYRNREEAIKAQKNMLIANGEQIQYCEPRKKYF